MLQSKLNRLGGAKDDLLRNHLLPPLLNSMNAYVTTDEKSLSKSENKAPFNVVTVVDPAIVPTGQNNAALTSSLVWCRQHSTNGAHSSLSDNVFSPTPPEARRTSAAPPSKRTLTSSARNHRDKLPSLKKRIQKLSELPALKAKLEKLKAKLREESLDGNLPVKKIQERARALLENELKREGLMVRRKPVSLDLIDMTSPIGANLMAKSMAVKGGFAAKLASMKQKERDIDKIGEPEKKKKKKKEKGPIKFKANLRSFKQQIAIEGTNYFMEMYLAPDIIENTRKYNIDINKPPKIIPNSTTAADMRDEYSNYCGQRKALKNWLFYV